MIRRAKLDFNVFDYTELDGHAMKVEAFIPGEGPIDRILCVKCLRKWTSPPNEEVAPEKQNEILHKFQKFFEDRGVRYRIDLNREP
jgi:hypothetical protein